MTYKQRLLTIVNDAMQDGLSFEEALEKLTQRQYDYLVEHGETFGCELQVGAGTGHKNRPSGLVYKKQYSDERKELFQSICNGLGGIGAQYQAEGSGLRRITCTLGNSTYTVIINKKRD